MKPGLLIAALALVVFPACQTGHAAPLKKASTTTTTATTPKAAARKTADQVPTPDLKPKAPTAELVIASVANKMKFNKKKLTVRTGEEVHLVFHNNATSKMLPHNWVLVKPGTQAEVAKAGLERGKSNDYLAPGPDILASTPLAAPGKTVSVTFTAPAPGTYPYICTVPGHHGLMNGQLVVGP